jgi:hypothetical protein
MPRDVTHMKRRCPRLGNVIAFEYCLEEGGPRQPCWKAIDCWWEYFDVVAVLKARVTPETLARLEKARPEPKVTSLIEQIAAAKARLDKER